MVILDWTERRDFGKWKIGSVWVSFEKIGVEWRSLQRKASITLTRYNKRRSRWVVFMCREEGGGRVIWVLESNFPEQDEMEMEREREGGIDRRERAKRGQRMITWDMEFIYGSLSHDLKALYSAPGNCKPFLPCSLDWLLSFFLIRCFLIAAGVSASENHVWNMSCMNLGCCRSVACKQNIIRHLCLELFELRDLGLACLPCLAPSQGEGGIICSETAVGICREKKV